MSKAQESIGRMQEILAECDVDPDAGVGFYVNESHGSVTAWVATELLTPERRALMVARLGQPTRGTKGGHDQDDATFKIERDTFKGRVHVRNWVWDSCGSCGSSTGMQF